MPAGSPPDPALSPQITAVWHGTLVKLLRSLYTLALPATSKELLSVEQEVRWRMRRLKFKHLAFLAESSATHMQERGSQELLAELLLSLERRWAEIEDGRTLVALLTKAGSLSESLMNHLEDKVLGWEQGREGGGPAGSFPPPDGLVHTASPGGPGQPQGSAPGRTERWCPSPQPSQCSPVPHSGLATWLPPQGPWVPCPGPCRALWVVSSGPVAVSQGLRCMGPRPWAPS